MESFLSASSVRNSAVIRDYGDVDLLGDVISQLRWDLMRLSDLPPVEGDGEKYVNGVRHAREWAALELDTGQCASTASADQVAAAKAVAALTVRAAKAAKPRGKRFALSVGKLRIWADIREAGLFIIIRAEFRWLEPVKPST